MHWHHGIQFVHQSLLNLGKNESVPRSSYSLLSRYSGIHTKANNQRYKERIPTWKDNIAKYYNKSPLTAKTSWSTKSLGNYVSDYPLTRRWKYLKKKFPNTNHGPRLKKGWGEFKLYGNSRSFAWMRSSTYSQFTKLIDRAALLAACARGQSPPSVQPSPNRLG